MRIISFMDVIGASDIVCSIEHIFKCFNILQAFDISSYSVLRFV